MDALGLLESIVQLEGIPYEQLARRFRMIENNMHSVIVPYMNTNEGDSSLGFQRGEVGRLVKALEYAEHIGGIARKLQRYLVQVPKHGLDAMSAAGAVQRIGAEKFGDQFIILTNQSLYDLDCGLSWENPDFLKAELAVV